MISSLALAATLAAGSTAAFGADPSAGGELRIFNWEDFMDPEVVANFEAEFGIEISIDFFTDENEMTSVIESDTSRYDLVFIADTVISEMAGQILLARLDHANIPNLSNVDPFYLDLPNDPGNTYSVPYDWGTTGITYNTDCLDAPDEESWALLMDPSIRGPSGA
jgi:spermidine/putrescine transport system substrate-binding protein